MVEFPARHQDAHLPELGPIAAFTLRGRCELGEGRAVGPAVFTGLTRRLRTHVHDDRHVVLLAAFTPVGAAGLLQSPLEAATENTADLATLIHRPEALDRLLAHLTVAPSADRAITHLEDFLLGQLRATTPDPLVSAAVSWLDRDREGSRRITALADHIGLSQSALERRFRRVVGIAPKTYASLARLKRAVNLREAGADSTTAAHEAGYYDQSHFIHAFREATGRTPDAFFARPPAANAEFFQSVTARVR